MSKNLFDLLTVDRPRDAEAIDQHAKTTAQKVRWNGTRTAPLFRERIKDPFRFRWIVDADYGRRSPNGRIGQ